ncbi:hypothetical protein [Mucilaginibacter sp. dw_454]|uniref:hypothetical protein n=1 Tax=Mucilaginibacter sp. dw_454 TaxID=2720079 RepID=UPI001BD1DF85|nr:hypothetical protein [Mucilaginibacter sp. dw_454]
MKKLISILSITALLYSCQNDISSNPTTPPILQGLTGHWFLQPIDRQIAGDCVETKSTISINFIDSIYCNVEITSIGGDISLSRKYKIDSNKLVFENPTLNTSVDYYIKINSKDSTLTLSEDAQQLFKCIPYNQKTKSLLYSENTLQKLEFLYPTLTVKEREGLHFEEINGKLQQVDYNNGSGEMTLDKLF